MGSFRNEGFGHVIYNPAFLDAQEGKNGEAKFSLKSPDKNDNGGKSGKDDKAKETTPLTKFLDSEARRGTVERDIYQKVNTFVDDSEKAKIFSGEQFASQWGEIRSIASTCNTKAELTKKLYDTADAYLTHGVASQKWAERKRLDMLKKFVGNFKDEAPQAVIQLASEMAKRCKRNV